MDELIKFLPIALYLIYRAYSASKGKQEKPKPRPIPEKKPTRKPSSIEEILRELRQETLTEDLKPIPVATKKNTPAKINIIDHQNDEVADYVLRNKKTKSPRITRVMSEDDASHSEFDIENIDLRDAIIYDAILNRPQY